MFPVIVQAVPWPLAQSQLGYALAQPNKDNRFGRMDYGYIDAQLLMNGSSDKTYYTVFTDGLYQEKRMKMSWTIWDVLHILFGTF